MARAMGLDVGTKTIGVAVSDELGLAPHPVCTVSRQGVRKDTAEIVRLAEDREVDTFVVGLPLELDGSEARSARLARQIGSALAEATGRRVLYVDERFTSVEAERALILQGVSRAKRKQVIDQAAAMSILRSWLEHGDRIAEEEVSP